MDQKQMYYGAVRKQGEADELLMEMIRHPTHPMTKDELQQMIDKHPDRYGRYQGIADNL